MSNEYVYDEKNLGGNGLVVKGKYEATIERIEKRTTPNGKEKLSIMFRIRKDVDQAYGGKCLFEDIWKEKQADYYNRQRLNQLLGTQHPKDGTVFRNIDEIILFLLNKPLKINVDIQLNDYTGEDVNTISFYESSSIKVEEPRKLGESQPEPVEIDDDDLPF